MEHLGGMRDGSNLGLSVCDRNAKCKMQNAKSENGETMREIVCKNDFSIGDNHFWSVE